MTTGLTEQDLSSESIARQLVSEIRADPRVRAFVLRELLTEDFLKLPEEIREYRNSTDRRLDALEQGQQRLTESIQLLTGEVQRLTEGQQQLTEGQQQLTGDVQRLTEGQHRLTGDVQQLTGDVQQLAESVRRLTQGYQRLDGQVGNLRGHSYEQKCSEQLELVMVDHFADIAIIDRSNINNLLLQARRDGRLTRPQFDQGRVIDIIGRGTPLGEQLEVQAVVEVSATINQQDIHNARRRAVLLQDLTGVNTRAFCVANAQWSDELEDEADQLGVTLVRYEMPGYEIPGFDFR